MTFSSNYKVGQRVQLHPATDYWMRGARYGEVVSVRHNGHRCHDVLGCDGCVYRIRLDVTGGIACGTDRIIAEVVS